MELLLRFFGFCFKIVGYLITPLLAIINYFNYRPIQIPPIENELLKIAAIDLAAKIRNKEVNMRTLIKWRLYFTTDISHFTLFFFATIRAKR